MGVLAGRRAWKGSIWCSGTCKEVRLSGQIYTISQYTPAPLQEDALSIQIFIPTRDRVV